MILWLIACGGPGDPINGGGKWGDYIAIREDDSRVFRDDGAEEEPDRALLLHAHAVDGARFEVRRGERWADATPVGEIAWDLSDGLVLESLSLDGFSAPGGLRLLNADSEAGELVPSAGYQCIVGSPGEVETWYGVFIDGVELDCEGSGMAGTWSFARDFGLVRYEGAIHLNLVAPW